MSCHISPYAPFFPLQWLSSSHNVTIFPMRLEAHEGRGCDLLHFLYLSQSTYVIPVTRLKRFMRSPPLNSFKTHGNPGGRRDCHPQVTDEQTEVK